MDIPETGAIFTLGQSYLAENTQSYFFIKNDPVKTAITGPSQSAVICESGRLFVWGENQFGQLGIGNINNDIITKPTCVKSLKLLGLKVKDISFGIGWAVILTHSNEVFFTGRNIFPRTSKIFKNFQEYQVNGEKQYLIKKPLRLIDIDEKFLNNNDNGNDIEIFVKCYAGNDHFILETSHERLFGWGSNDSNQLGLINELHPIKPIELKIDFKLSKIVCGPKSTLILTDLNKLYLCGHLNDSNFTEFTELIGPQDAASTVINFIYVSRSNEIFIINEFGGIYRSSESTRKKLHFQKFYDYDHDEYGPVWKLLKGSSFYVALTKSHKFFTTFSESGHHLKTFREISKFKNLKVLDAAIGDRHILVLGIQKGIQKKSHEKLNNSAAATLSKTYTIGSNAVKIINVSKEPQITDDKNDFNENIDINSNEQEVIKPNTPVSEDQKIDNLEALVEETKSNNEDHENNNEIGENNNNVYEHNNKESEAHKMDSILIATESNELEKLNTESENADQLEEVSEKTDVAADTVSILENNSEDISIDNINDTETAMMMESSLNDNNPKSNDDNEINENELISAEINNGEKNPTSQNHLTKELNESSNSLNNIENEPTNIDAENEIINDSIHEEPPPSIEDVREELIEKTSSEITKYVLDNTNDTDSLNDESLSNDVFTNNPLPIKMHLPPLKSLSKSSFNNLSASPSVKFDQNSIKSEKSTEHKIRPRTPYPSDSSTPQTVKRKQRKQSETNNPEDDLIEHTSMTFSDSLETSPSEKNSTTTTIPAVNHEIEEIVRKSSPNSQYTIKQRFSAIKNDLEDELEIEVERKENLLDKTVVEEIRFINDGIDVTEKVTKSLHKRTISKIDNINENLNVLHKNAKNLTQMNNDYEIAKTPDDSEESSKNKSSMVNGTGIEDDERTTASVNSNKNDDDEKKEFYNEIRDDIIEVGGKGKKTVRRFINGIKNTGKGISCRTNKSVKVEDEPPEYTPVDQHLEDIDVPINNNKTSKVCTIL